ncbi:MAG: tetratricopeptide repeat protein [Planctomycetota bacterium]
MFDPRNAIQLIAKRIASGNSEDAIEIAEQALAQYRDDGRLYEMAGLAYFAAGRHSHAIERMEKARRKMGLSINAQLCLASCYWKTGVRHAALAIADRIKARFMHASLHRRHVAALVHWYAGNQMFESAADICLRVFQENSCDSEACLGIAWYRSLTDIAESTTTNWLEAAVRLRPDNAAFRIALGKAYAEQNEKDSAIRIFLGLSAPMIEQIECASCLASVTRYLKKYHHGDSPVVSLISQRLTSLNSRIRN